VSDDRTKRGPADRSRINVHEPYEVEYWTKKFGITEARLRQLVTQHGVMVADIERALGK
jgi:hypothetical protein